MKKVAVIPGFTEGKWHTARLLSPLETNGFTITPVDQANILITHSSGAYLPKARKKVDLLVINGLPMFSRKTTIAKISKKVYRDFDTYRKQGRSRDWAQKTSFNSYYFFRHPLIWFEMLMRLDVNNLNHLQAKKIVIINNQQDIFNKSSVIEALAKERNWIYYQVSGDHDDIWEHPDKYVAIIKECL